MLTEPLPIEIFVSTRFSEKHIISVIESWRVESDELQKIITNYFREIGIFSVPPVLEREVTATILSMLQNSPEIYKMVKKAEAQDDLRRQSKRFE